MESKHDLLEAALRHTLAARITSLTFDRGEFTVEVAADEYVSALLALRDDPSLRFEQLIDLCGVDYSEHVAHEGLPRFAVVVHLLSVLHNWRVRVRVYAPDGVVPEVDSIVNVWRAANWYEREAFDLYGIAFKGHPDLRRILTDYGFVGYPFRKDFPVSGFVEMRYDADQRRVVYQPVSIAPREVTPRIAREDNYGQVGHV